eukprot:349824-Chlamydomonas_euryale.AAC.6
MHGPRFFSGDSDARYERGHLMGGSKLVGAVASTAPSHLYMRIKFSDAHLRGWKLAMPRAPATAGSGARRDAPTGAAVALCITPARFTAGMLLELYSVKLECRDAL